MRNRYAILIIFASVVGYFLLASFALSEPLPTSEASPMQLVFLLNGDPSAPVDVELQNGLNHPSFF
jgi:hypothetical protein